MSQNIPEWNCFISTFSSGQSTSLTNLFRNQGGSFGIAFVTTMLERRSQHHQAILSVQASLYNPLFAARLHDLAQTFHRRGDSTVDAGVRATAELAALVQHQSAMLGFLDCFRLLGVIAFAGPVLALGIRKFALSGDKKA
jgi:DHA2 family multidrug resistance protein